MNAALPDQTLIDRTHGLLADAAGNHAPAALASSMGAEDMVLIHMIASLGLPIAIFTLDTGRLHAETHDLIQVTRARYGLPIEIYAPEASDIEAYCREFGPDGFFRSVDLRLECCRIRKVLPLGRALAGRQAWITGMRRAQSPTRRDIAERENDSDHGMMKFNPLADWGTDDVAAYIAAHGVPTNRLHKQGYASIGCAPCTRPVAPGEDERAGRWWWENPDNRECGLHVAAAQARN